MNNTQFADIWWKAITGPSQLVQRVVSDLQNCCHNIIVMPQDLPWRWNMRFSVENRLSEIGLHIEYIDCADDYQNLSQNFDDFILRRFSSDEIYFAYRPYSGEAIQDYLLRNHVLDGTVIWLKGMNKEQYGRVLEFCRQFKPYAGQQGLFVIETIETSVKKLPSYIKVHNCEEHITKYDTLLFATLIAANLPLSNLWQQYAARVVASLCIEDAEISAELIEKIDFTSELPIEGLRKVFEENYQDKKRGSAYSGGEKHPFLLVRENDQDTLNYRVWKAQLEIAFPLIEEERFTFIRKWYKNIDIGLHYVDEEANWFGTQITNPQDAELGLLVHMLHTTAVDGQIILSIPSENDYQRLHFLHQQRNILAHMGHCSPRDLNTLFNAYHY